MNLVTGATGLLGSHVLVALVKNGQPCRASFRNESKVKEIKKLFDYYFQEEAYKKWELIQWVQADLTDFVDVEQLVKGTENVYHCAALVSFFKADFERCLQQNRYVTACLVDFSLKHNIKHFCHVSSTAAIGGAGKLVNEATKWQVGGKHSGYGISKLLAEREVWRGIEEGLNAVIVNPCVILGPAAQGSPSLQMLETAKNGLLFYTSGSNAVVDARDVAKTMIELVEKGVVNQRYLVVGPQQSFKDLFTQFALQLGKNPPRIAVSKNLTYLFAIIHELWCHMSGKRSGLSIETARSSHQNVQYDINKIQTELSFEYTPLDQIIKNMISGQAYITKA
ncbi:MAG: NAD-dependent epimerase/dehydratase family protein [Flavobacteriales bacterium]